MTLEEFRSLSPEERIALAPTIAKYNRDSTETFAGVIRQINHAGIGSLSPHNMVVFTLCLDNVPPEETKDNK